MRILHTADWHLGQTFHGYDRTREHKLFLRWLNQTIATHEVDVVLVSGDVFDHANPASDTQQLFYNFIHSCHVAHPHLQLLITAGNHDSASPLTAPALLLQTHATKV